MAWCTVLWWGQGRACWGLAVRGGFLGEVLLAFHGGCKPDGGRPAAGTCLEPGLQWAPWPIFQARWWLCLRFAQCGAGWGVFLNKSLSTGMFLRDPKHGLR